MSAGQATSFSALGAAFTLPLQFLRRQYFVGAEERPREAMQHPLGTWLIQHQRFWLLLILGVAAMLRLVTLFGLRTSIYRDYLFTDERGYHDWAEQLAQGVPHYLCHISPLPAYYMAAIYRLFGVNLLHVRWANLVLGVATCWLLFGIGRRVGGTLVGLLSALLAAVYRPFVLLSVTVLKEPLVLLVFALMLWVLLGELKRHCRWQVFCLGLTSGLLLILRPNAGVALVIAAPILLWRAWARTRSIRSVVTAAVALAVGTLAPAAPVMVKNYQVAGQLSAAPQGGVELYLGNGDDTKRPYYVPAPFATPSPDEQGIDFRIEASRRLGRMLTFAEASSYWTHQVVHHALQKPYSSARRLVRKTIAALHAQEDSDNHSIEFLASVIPALRLPMLSYWLVMPLGMAGLVCGALRNRAALLLMSVVVSYGLTLVLVYCNLRLRVPLLVILIPFAAAGLFGLLRSGRWRSWRRGGFIALALAFGLLEHLPLAGAGDLTGPYNTHAGLLLERGDERGALAFWQKSQALRGAYSDIATVSLARYALVRGEALTAQAAVRAISDDSFAATLKYELLGDSLTADNRLPEAIAAYEKALDINSARRNTRRKLISIYESVDAGKAAQQEQALAYVESFFQL